MKEEDKAGDQLDLLTINVSQRSGEIVKPAELIELRGTYQLTLADKRIYNLLLMNAFGPEMAVQGRMFEVPLVSLRGNRNDNERVLASIHKLRHTDVIVSLTNGRVMEVTLLGAIIHDPSAGGKASTLQYSFDPNLIPILANSSIFARLEASLMADFTTKYALSLYEMVARRHRMKHRHFEVFSLKDLREFFGVPEGKLDKFAMFKLRAIEPAVAEVNLYAPFSCRIDIEAYEGRKVSHMRLSWWNKSTEELKEQYKLQHADDEEVLALFRRGSEDG